MTFPPMQGAVGYADEFVSDLGLFSDVPQDMVESASSQLMEFSRPARSYILLYRGYDQKPIFGGDHDPFCRRAAWIWLLQAAAWKDTSIDFRGVQIPVQRGQISTSYRALARAWNWSLPGTQRFIARCTTDTMISVSTDTGRMVITICNYEKYQGRENQPDTLNGRIENRYPIHPTPKPDTLKNQGIKRSKKNHTSCVVETDQLPTADLLPSADIVVIPDVGIKAVEMWNAAAREMGLPTVRDLTDIRRRRLMARLRAAGGLKGWEAMLAAIRQRPFLQGQNKDKWRCDFDFCIIPEKFAKILEGGYGGSHQKSRFDQDEDHWERLGPVLAEARRRGL